MISNNITPEAKREIESFVHSLGFCKPLFFASGSQDYPFYCGGTCFLVRYNCKFFIFTAKHCLRDDPEFVYVLTNNSQELIPIRRQLSPVDEGDDSTWADVCCLTTYSGEHLPNLTADDYIDFDTMIQRHIFADVGHQLVLKSYPYCEFEITSKNKLLKTPMLHMGRYGGTTESKHCHYFNVEYPELGDPNGMSGSPVVKLEYDLKLGAYPTVVGMVLQGSSSVQFLRFVGVDVLLRVLMRIQSHPF